MAKTASKTNPGRQKGSKATKMYKGKPVRPSRYIHRHCSDQSIDIMGAEYEDGGNAVDDNGMPVRWDSI